MEFKDFENKNDLVGKRVLYTSGTSYSSKKSLSLRTIEKVTKTGFRISEMPDALFDFNGYQKGLHDRMNMGTISECKLVSEEEENRLKQEWKRAREERELRKRMEEKFKTMTFEQLKQMELI